MNYEALIAALNELHGTALAGAIRAVNRQLILRNWLIGAHIVEYEQHGEDRAAYGTGLLERIALDLHNQGVKGLGVSMLRLTRRFFELYPQIRQPAIAESALITLPEIRQSLITECDVAPVATRPGLPTPLSAARVISFSWTHLIELIRLDDPWKRAFYENECLKGGWSVRQLQRQIGSLLYDRTVLSADKKTVIDDARQQAQEAPNRMADLIRDPYVLEFTGLAERPHYFESELEMALLDNLQSFLLELGTGFCFEARQRRVTVGEEHDYIDLVFYHRLLRCHLLIDLKARAFQHGDAGQMNFYLNYWKAEVMAEGDQQPVGLILCTDKKQTRVDYATAGIDHQLFVSRYLNVLPAAETLERLIEQDTAAWQQKHPPQE
jgi:predicted nuclease of restriction endonuclease-like (RecB) superfamily